MGIADMIGLHPQITAVMRTPPYRYQSRGVRFFTQRAGRAICGDDMGLGKTYQLIAYLKLNPDVRPAVIVVPATLKYKWQTEFRQHAGMRSDVCEGRKPHAMHGDIWIINYDILKYWVHWFIAQKPAFFGIDECHKFANPTSQRTIAGTTLARRCKKIIAMSGTPISNRPFEFFPVLNMIAPKEFPSLLLYAFNYCGAKGGFAGQWDFRGATNLPELHAKLKPFMIRRMKTEVLKELPRKTRTIIPLKINMAEYTRARVEFVRWLRAARGADAVRRARGSEAWVKIGVLRQLAAAAKLPFIHEWMHDYFDTAGNRKLVVFAEHAKIVSALSEPYKTAVVISGTTPQKQRPIIEHRFQTDPKCGPFIGNIVAASEGLTLTAASATAHAELAWVPRLHDQAEDRVLRIGQTATHVDAFYFIAMGTIEETILTVHAAKRDIFCAVVDGGERHDIQTRIIDSLLKGT